MKKYQTSTSTYVEVGSDGKPRTIIVKRKEFTSEYSEQLRRKSANSLRALRFAGLAS